MSAKYFNIIQEDSTPVYGMFTDYWDQSDWIKWHKELVARYGLTTANEIFLKAWESYPFWMLFPMHIGFRNTAFGANANFIEYAKQNQFYDNLFVGILGTIFKVQSTAVTATQDVATAVGSVASSTKTISSYILPVALGLGIIFLFFYTKKHKLI
jgi:hypothetical protein